MVKFGTSGLRGLAPDLLGGAARDHVAAFAAILRARPDWSDGGTVLIGRDRRDSSPPLAERVAATLAASGLTPVDCSEVPTPALALEAMRMKAAAIMITGSHIPADRNGLKFYEPEGEISKPTEEAIGAGAKNPVAEPSAVRIQSDGGASMARYRDRALALFPTGFLDGRTIGIYAHSSVSAGMLEDVLAHYGAKTMRLGVSSAFVPVDTEALTDDQKALLRDAANTHTLDAIVSTDADGDRPLLADETGTQVRGDALGILSARALGITRVVTPVTSNTALEALGFDVTRTRVGSPYVIAGMNSAHGPVIGFEANGGTLLGAGIERDDKRIAALPTRDAMLPLLAALHQSLGRGEPVSKTVAALGLRAATSGLLRNVNADRSGPFMRKMADEAAFRADFIEGLGKIDRVSTIDGVQVFLTSNAMIHLRPSGNAPEMRCYAEAETISEADHLMKEGLERLSARL